MMFKICLLKVKKARYKDDILTQASPTHRILKPGKLKGAPSDRNKAGKTHTHDTYIVVVSFSLKIAVILV